MEEPSVIASLSPPDPANSTAACEPANQPPPPPANTSTSSPTSLPPSSFKFGASQRNPFSDNRLGGALLQSIGAPPKGGGLPTLAFGGTKLKKAVEVKFVDISFVDQYKQSIEGRLRTFDKVRKYLPLRCEQAELNIPDERVDIHQLTSVLYLCGGSVGVRFLSPELSRMAAIIRPLGAIYAEMESIFQSLTSHYRKLVLHNEVVEQRVVETAHDQTHLHRTSSKFSINGPLSFSEEIAKSLQSTKGVTATTHNPSSSASSNSSDGSVHTPKDSNNSNNYDCYSDLPSVLRFHMLADEYVLALLQIQAFVKEKQREIIPAQDREIPKGSTDDAAGKGQQYPQWLSVLISKYNAITNPVDGLHTDTHERTTTAPPFHPADVDARFNAPINIVPPPELLSIGYSNTSTSSSETLAATAPSPSPVVVPPSQARAKPSLLSPSRNKAANNSKLKPITCGKLANMISCCLFHKIELTNEEFDAVEEMLEASNDSVCQYYITNNFSAYRFSQPDRCLFAPLAQAQGQRYWAKRVFEFVSRVVEVKSWSKDEKSLYLFELFVDNDDEDSDC